ncbi:sugar ABC transporter ATP-binding protein [Lichenibacterium minor]|uniref:Sugar ABC transporter ATP-binding protein n=1 Tax=Lichenibacterium minor TaxID=2316528 RepID=A0A4Q2U2W2_9HYPH|nr:sugar ABC transporter ATP-binding protein [Lichenibacterium minor]RYC29231.1 sugar ABC transporter ATP-binding protein [Lichenibacterium minor]
MPAADAMCPAAILAVKGVTKSFPGVLALDGVSFEVRAGEVNALVGENGAGKSTLIKLMAGFHAPDAGSITVGGALLHPDPAAAHEAGIATIHQESHLVPGMTVAENIALGRWPTRFGLVSRAAQFERARAVLTQVAPGLPPDELARRLSPAEQQLVEIARAVAEDSRVLIMDEPTTSLSGPEIDQLFAVVRALRARGLGIVFVSHWLEEVFAIADRVTVLRDGRFVGSRAAADLDTDKVVTMMVGRPVEAMRAAARPLGSPVLEVDGLTRLGMIDDVSFTVRAGEIVGLAGLVGAGRSETAACIFGIDPYDRGAVSIGGTPVPRGGPTAAIAAGMALLPEDRRQQGLVSKLSVRSNATLAVLDRITRHGLISGEAEDGILREASAGLSIKMASPEVPIATLSGGNQQKVILARWLARRPKLLILDEPTKGVDIGAKAEISAIIIKLAEAGTAILLISSEMPEILSLSDRVLVMRGGRITAELDRPEIAAETIMTFATTG